MIYLEIAGKTIGYIPVVGDTVEFVLDADVDKEQAKEDAKFIKEQFGSIEMAAIYRDYDCCVNFVDFDMEENNGHVLYPHVGETTDYKLNLINTDDELRAVLSSELTRSMILRNPESIWKFAKRLEETGSIAGKYEEIIGGKR